MPSVFAIIWIDALIEKFLDHVFVACHVDFKWFE
jgi:hypothetical protein